jgi:lysophospholipase L1-like esterase/LysM repeat protein
VRYESNIIFHAQSLLPYFQSLQRLENLEENQVCIFHFGDSHLQADGFSGVVRTELQKKYGSAGRGLVFPYRLAKTNHPRDLFSQTNTTWQAKRNIIYFPDFPTGILGYGAKTSDPNFVFKLGTKTFNGIENSFDRIWLFHANGPEQFDYLLLKTEEGKPIEVWENERVPLTHRVGRKETVNTVAKQYKISASWIKKTNRLKSNNLKPGSEIIVGYSNSKQPRVINGKSTLEPLGYVSANDGSDRKWNRTLIDLGEPMTEVTFGGLKTKGIQKEAHLYGLVLENSEASGIAYHTAGVNGAQLPHFIKSDHFLDQAISLQPKLVIVSLGTNEVFDNNLDTAAWGRNIDTLLKRFRAEVPGVCFLFTTPPDSWRNGTPRPLLESISKILYQKADELDFALWDFREVMGGKGSMKKWNRARLSQDDLVHFTQTGYNLQGFLLIEALEKAQKEMYGH